jgi:hypothetical protein
MTYRVILALMIGMIGVANAHAEAPVRAQSLSIGGAAMASSDAARITMWQTDDGVSAGLAPTSASLASSTFGAPGMQAGGFLAWQSSIYRIDASLNPNFDGQTVAALGASIGAMPGEIGTSYGLHIGTSFAATDHFTINPASGLGLAELAAPTNNLSVSLMISHALTPNLNLIGLAEAQRNFGNPALEGTSYSTGIGRLVVGAGIGYKF